MVKDQIKQHFATIREYAANPLGDMRVIDDFPVGYHVRQGDVYVFRVDDFDKESFDFTSERQLAPGDTLGSRHTVSDAVNVYKPVVANRVEQTEVGYMGVGPVIVSKDRWTLMHPEHADISICEGTYQIYYQIDPQTMSRVLD